MNGPIPLETVPARTRPATLRDLPKLLRLNESSVPHVSGLSPRGMRALFDEAVWFRVVETDGMPAAFLIALGPGAKYRSENYLWFASRYREFIYIDRIVVASHCRKRGVGRLLYCDLESFAIGAGVPLLAVEVNLKPPNQPSLNFHQSQGFAEIGTQWTGNGTKFVSLRVKILRTSQASPEP